MVLAMMKIKQQNETRGGGAFKSRLRAPIFVQINIKDYKLTNTNKWNNDKTREKERKEKKRKARPTL